MEGGQCLSALALILLRKPLYVCLFVCHAECGIECGYILLPLLLALCIIIAAQ